MQTIYLNPFFNPDLARSINKKSNFYKLASLSFRLWWHHLYDNCPSLLKYLKDDGKNFLEKTFLILKANNNLNLGYHLNIINYIKLHQKELYKKEIIGELIFSFCNNWVRKDSSDKTSILVYNKNENNFYVGTKSTSLGVDPCVEIYENEEKDILLKDLSVLEIDESFELIEDKLSLLKKMRKFDEVF